MPSLGESVVRIEDARVDRDTELNTIIGAMPAPAVMPELSRIIEPQHFAIDAHRFVWEELVKLHRSGKDLSAPNLDHALNGRRISKSVKQSIFENMGRLGTDRVATLQSGRQLRHWFHLRKREELLRELEANGAADVEAFSSVLEEALRHEATAKDDTSWLRRGSRPMPELIPANEMSPIEHEDVLIKPGIAIRKGLSLLTGPSKVGKSFMVLEFARALLAGDHMLGLYPVLGQYRVAYIQGELSGSQLAKRIGGLNIEAKDRLFLVNVQGSEFRLNTETQGGWKQQLSTGAERGLIKLAKSIRQRQVDVVIFDPLYTFLEGSELDEIAMKSAFRNLEALAEVTNTAIVVVHHNRKQRSGDAHNAEMSSGNSVLHRAPLALMTVINHQTGSMPKPRIKMHFQLRCAEPIEDVEILSGNGKWWAAPWASDTKLLVYNTIKESKVPVRGKEVVTALEGQVKRSQVYLYLRKLRDSGEVEYLEPHYWVENR